MEEFEPDVLRLGKPFDERARVRYLGGLDDAVPAPTRTMMRSAGTARWAEDGSELVHVKRKGRGYADILSEIPDDNDQPVWHVVIGIKNTDWDQRATQEGTTESRTTCPSALGLPRAPRRPL